MQELAGLWLPILASAVAVWFWCALAWMALPHHKRDWSPLPDEDAFLSRIRSLQLPPGQYAFPDMRSKADKAALEAKMKTGPMGLINIWPPINMPRNMLATFAIQLFVSALLGYLGAVALEPGAAFGQVMQVMATGGILAYGFAFLPNMVWFNAGRAAMLSCTFDGVVSGLLTGAIFAALWP